MKKPLFILFLLPFISHAATAVVEIDTLGNNINALGATLNSPAGVTLQNVSTGNSAILFWVTPPEISGNTLTFSGITPGGIIGTRDVLSVDGNFTADDLKKVTFTNVQALKNDGSGTPAEVKLSIIMSEAKPADTNPPEAFPIVVATSTELFDGHPFIAFSTQDKGSGIDHYEVAFTRLLSPSAGDWHVTSSPLELSDLTHKIFVKAVDKSGNIRIEELETPEYTHWWEVAIGLAIIIVLILGALLKKLWPKHEQSQL